MRAFFAYSLLIVYAVALLKPVLPPTLDWMSHTFALYHHLATVHQHHGNSHVDKEMAKEADHTDTDQTPARGFSDPVSAHVHTSVNFILLQRFHPVFPKQLRFTDTLFDGFLTIDIPPPRLPFITA